MARESIRMASGGTHLLAQRFARRANPITTVIYTRPSDEELCARIAGI